MDTSSIIESIALVKPELVISALILVCVLFDLIFDKNKKILPYIVVAGISLCGVFVLMQFNNGGAAFFTESINDTQYGMVSVDNFGSFFKLIIVIASIFVVFFSIYSNEINKVYERIGEYFTLILGMVLGMLLMISASDLILIYLSLELLSLSSYVLAGFTKLRDRSSEAALKYLLYGAISSGIMLFGISLLYGLTGSTNLYVISNALQLPNINLLTLSFAIVMIFTGIGYKISAAPFHFWTPDVYEGAPISITAYLSVASKAAGFALLIRFVKTTFVAFVNSSGVWEMLGVFDWQALLVIVAILTMTLGNFSALWQNNLKRMLAYSSIAHAGYMLLALAVLTDQGILALLIYFVYYLFMNLGAFFIVMVVDNKLGTEELDDYDGLGGKSSFYGIAFAIFLFSLVGLPPTAGFIGKLYLFIALIDAKMIAVAVIAVLNTVVSLYYYVRVLKHMYLNKPEKEIETFSLNPGHVIVILLLLIPTLLFGVYFTPVVNFAKNSLAILGL
jgi:NADH-quinone oxidoreductase subunit N